MSWQHALLHLKIFFPERICRIYGNIFFLLRVKITRSRVVSEFFLFNFLLFCDIVFFNRVQIPLGSGRVYRLVSDNLGRKKNEWTVQLLNTAYLILLKSPLRQPFTSWLKEKRVAVITIVSSVLTPRACPDCTCIIFSLISPGDQNTGSPSAMPNISWQEENSIAGSDYKGQLYITH